MDPKSKERIRKNLLNAIQKRQDIDRGEIALCLLIYSIYGALLGVLIAILLNWLGGSL